MCGCPVGGNGWPGGAQWTPSGPTTGLTTSKQVHPLSLSCFGLRPPDVLDAVAGKTSAAAMSGISNRRISPHLLRPRFPVRALDGSAEPRLPQPRRLLACALPQSLLIVRVEVKCGGAHIKPPVAVVARGGP